MSTLKFLLTFLLLTPAFSEASIDSYLSQVKESHSSFVGSIKKIRALDKKSELAELVFYPEVFSNIEWRQDRGPRLNIAFQGNQSETTLFDLGFRKKTRYGLDATLSFRSFRENFEGRPSQFFPLNDYYTNNLVLNLEQSLLRNSFGKQNRLEEKQVLAANFSEALTEERKALEVLVSAQKAYWSLAVSKEVLKTLEESTKRAKAILDYNTNRYNRKIVDVGEVLAAKAGYLQRRLELEEAKDNLALAQKDFDGFLENTNYSKPLIAPQTAYVLNLKAPDLSKKSLLYLTQEQSVKAIKYRNEASIESAKPELKVYGNLTTGEINGSFDQATGGAFSTDRPVYTIGVNFSTPLAFGKIKTLFQGYTEEVAASEVQLQRLITDERVNKDKTLKLFMDLQERLKLSQELETAQKKKLENEKRLQKNGRSTTYRVLLFEQDYLAAQVSSLRLKLSIMQSYADFSGFGRLKSFL